jgi:hypothetical protein
LQQPGPCPSSLSGLGGILDLGTPPAPPPSSLSGTPTGGHHNTGPDHHPGPRAPTGNSVSCTLRRLKRDAPPVAEPLACGEYLSARAAGRAILVCPPLLERSTDYGLGNPPGRPGRVRGDRRPPPLAVLVGAAALSPVPGAAPPLGPVGVEDRLDLLPLRLPGQQVILIPSEIGERAFDRPTANECADPGSPQPA